VQHENSQFNVTMKKDPNLKDDTILKMGDNEITYENLKEMYKVKNHEPIRLLVYWDDVCQYTSIGLIETLNALTEGNAEIDIEHFLQRPNEYELGITYVYKLFEKVLTKDEVDFVRDRFYWKIMQISLKSKIFQSIMSISSFITQIGFFFPTKFETWDQLRIDIHGAYFKDMNPEIIQFYHGKTLDDFNNILKLSQYNCIITPDIKNTYNYIMDNDLERISIMGPNMHNGISDEVYEVFEKFKNFPKPNYCSVNLYEEQFVI
jgi:hypothetical protein